MKWASARLLPLMLVVGGCQSTTPDAGFLGSAGARVNDHLGVPIDVDRLLNATPPAIQGDIEPELAMEQAVERALAHNLWLRASAENLAIAHAQLVQAGLLTNPTIGQSNGFLFPTGPFRATPAMDFNLSQQINSLFTRTDRIAQADIQRTEAAIDFASQAIDLALSVHAKYGQYLHLRRQRALARRISELYSQALQAAQARAKVGIVPTPEVNRARLQLADAERQERRLDAASARALRELNWLMGEQGDRAWTLHESTPGPGEQLDPEQAMRLARASRLEVERADFDERLARAGETLARDGMIPAVTASVEAARDTSHAWSVGPSFSITLPIFDNGRTGVVLAQAQVRKAIKSRAAMLEQVAHEANLAASALALARGDAEFYRDQFIPQQEDNVRIAQQAFELGRTDLDSFLNTLRDYVGALQAAEEAQAALSDAIVDLERATGTSRARFANASSDPEPPAMENKS
jgi:cobalt-zinc-cadmium efflux system outer membrane protein